MLGLLDREIKIRKINVFNWPTKNKNNIILVITIILIIVVLIDRIFFNYYILGTLLTIDAILLSIILLVIMVLAGFQVLRSLFLLAVELSLLIFLAQSYCAVPQRLISGDVALKNLLTFGILYIIFSFFYSLYKSSREYYKKIETEKFSKEKIITIILYLLFIYLFVQQIYQIIKPIILNLCVYK